MRGPYVFVGHSYGAVFARMHAHAAPEDVLGVVLVDPAHEEQFQRIPAMANQSQLTVMPHLARIGLLRLLSPFDEVSEGMPESVLAPWRAVSYTTRHAAAFRDEGRFVRDVVSPWLLTQDTDLHDIPVRVFHAADAVWPDPQVRTMQEELLGVSTDSQGSELPGDHFSILTLPRSARAIADAIGELANTPPHSN